MARGFTHESFVNNSVEWYTPPELFDALGLVFDLDPCSPGQGLTHVPAHKVYTEADDGLVQPWHGMVFVNPPYGTQTGKWMDKLADHGNGVALVFARPDTAWAQRAIRAADITCFIRGRVRFYQGDKHTLGGTPGSGSMLLGYGDKAVEAITNAGLGPCMIYKEDT